MNNLLLVSFLALAFGILACNPDKDRKVNDTEAKFTTSDASELFFRNVRQGYYDKETMKEAKLDIYRIKERNRSDEVPVINLAIVVNWRYDEAYVLTEPNEYLEQQDTLKVYWRDTTNQQGVYEYIPGNKQNHFRFASHIYNSLQDKHRLYTDNSQGERIPLLANHEEREAFRRTMMDYYRLVDLY